MSDCLVVFTSLNQVALLKRALYRRGIFVEMQRTPSCLVETGCSYALRCDADALAALEHECGRFGIVPGGSFQADAAEKCGFRQQSARRGAQ